MFPDVAGQRLLDVEHAPFFAAANATSAARHQRTSSPTQDRRDQR